MTVDLATAGADTFEPFRDAAFTIMDGDVVVPAVLGAVDRRGAVTGFRNPFSLVFLVDRATQQHQGIHVVRHPELGDMPLFLVPIQPTAQHARYEAAFG